MQKEPTLSPEEDQPNGSSGEENTTNQNTSNHETDSTAVADSTPEVSQPDAIADDPTPPISDVPEENNPQNTSRSEPISKTAFEIDFDQLPLEEFPKVMENILKHSQWMKLGNQVRSLQERFDQGFLVLLQEKKESFISDGGNEIDFYYAPEFKKEFTLHLREYKRRKKDHYNAIEAEQKANLNRKKEIIEEIKQLIDHSEHNNNTYKQFKNLQEAFHATGQVPRGESNNIWQTYKFHVERFYDFLHLNRDLRDADFKHNYTEKLKIIERAEALAELPDIIVAIRELNLLHRLWKNDLGPVAREHREELWKRFQAATKIIHQRKNEYNKNIDSIHEENRQKKEEILVAIEAYSKEKPTSHNAWQNAIKKVNALRDEFHAIGRVPKSDSKRLWNSYRTLSREFNQNKNLFYREHKAQEKNYVKAKKALIEEVTTILNEPNWRDHVNRMKAIQNDWKKTGRISRKLSNKLWEEFRSLTNQYFDRLKNKTAALSAEDQAKTAAQNNFVEEIITTEAPTTPKKLETFIAQSLDQWIGLEPIANSPAQKKLLHHLTGLWDHTSLSAKDKAAQKFSTQLGLIKTDPNALEQERSHQKKKIDEIAAELIQLQNNLQFFSSSSNDSPMVVEVNKKIEQLSKAKESLEEKTNAIKSLQRSIRKQETAAASDEEETTDQETPQE